MPMMVGAPGRGYTSAWFVDPEGDPSAIGGHDTGGAR
jgi:hypothetical protein